MGRPINRKWFGAEDAAVDQKKITATGAVFSDGYTETDAIIIKQTGTRTYIVSRADGKAPEQLTMVNGNGGIGSIKPGHCSIKVRPFGGPEVTCEKIQQYRVSVFEADGSIKSYSWGTQLATKMGQADLFFVPEESEPAPE